jgi:hypothetical protein
MTVLLGCRIPIDRLCRLDLHGWAERLGTASAQPNVEKKKRRIGGRKPFHDLCNACSSCISTCG